MLRLENVTKRFGGVTATKDVSLAFPAESLSAIIGPNGAGKTTLFNLITGHLKPTNGTIFLDSSEISGLRPAAIVRRGIGRSFQIASIFPTLTVRDSLAAAIGAHLGSERDWCHPFPKPDIAARTDQLIETMELRSVANEVSGNISHGDQKLLDIGLALALKPRVLLLDEPAAGMGPEERVRMMQTVKRLWQQGGITVAFIEHDIDLVFNTAQTVHVLKYGEVLVSGAPDEVRNNQDVIDAYLGTATEHDAGAANV